MIFPIRKTLIITSNDDNRQESMHKKYSKGKERKKNNTPVGKIPLRPLRDLQSSGGKSQTILFMMTITKPETTAIMKTPITATIGK